jgi:hypothetical protein
MTEWLGLITYEEDLMNEHKPSPDCWCQPVEVSMGVWEHRPIRTEKHIGPNGPEWTAVDDSTYDGPGSPMGWGAAEHEAIRDLCEQLRGRRTIN